MRQPISYKKGSTHPEDLLAAFRAGSQQRWLASVPDSSRDAALHSNLAKGTHYQQMPSGPHHCSTQIFSKGSIESCYWSVCERGQGRACKRAARNHTCSQKVLEPKQR